MIVKWLFRINDRFPIQTLRKGRIIDLSYRAAKELRMVESRSGTGYLGSDVSAWPIGSFSSSLYFLTILVFASRWGLLIGPRDSVGKEAAFETSETGLFRYRP